MTTNREHDEVSREISKAAKYMKELASSALASGALGGVGMALHAAYGSKTPVVSIFDLNGLQAIGLMTILYWLSYPMLIWTALAASCLVATLPRFALLRRRLRKLARAEVWRVTVDVFSGQPNPVFTLEPSEVAKVRARLDSAPWVRSMASANETIVPARLGCPGMRVKASAGDEVIEDTEISESKILRKTTGALWDGTSAGLEGYLLSLAVAKGAISQGLADDIKSQSNGSIP